MIFLQPQPFSFEAMRDIELAAALEGVSIEKLTEKAATIYARQLLAKRDALPLMRPESWRQFRMEKGGSEVSFRVCVPVKTFSHAVLLEKEVKKRSGGCYPDACDIVEKHLRQLFDFTYGQTLAKDEEIKQALDEWNVAQRDLAKRLKEIEMEVNVIFILL